MSDAQTEILGRISRAQYAHKDAAAIALELESIGPAPAPPMDCEDILETFLVRLAKNTISLDVVANRSEAVRCISSYLYREHNTHKVVAGHDRRLAALPWRDGGVLVRFDTASPDDPVSISYAKLGIAESGSLVLYSNRENPASNNWLVKDHIILLEGKDLVRSYEDAWAWMRSDLADKEQPRGISFISGPSSTGDIVGHMVRGAHGPQRLHLVFIGEIPPGLTEAATSRAAASKA